MVPNILKLLKNQIDDNVIDKIAGFLGENKSGVMAAIGSALPSLLLGFMKKGTEPGGANYLMSLLQERKQDEGLLGDLGSALGGGSATADLLSSGKNLLGSILGDKGGGIGDLIASSSGISKKAGSSLLGMLAPIVMGFLGKTLKSQGSFNASSLTSLLLGQKDHIKGSLPSGITNLLGVSDFENLGRQAVQAAAAPTKKIWSWIVLIIACVAIFLLWRNCSMQEVAQKATDTAKQAASAVEDTAAKVAEQARDAWAALGQFFSKKLPSGVELNIPELGVENQLLAFIEDPQRPVDDKTWFSFDRLTFETGKATLKPESQEQLKNIAEILKAYPRVTVKIGGYTDNTGDPQANLRLSQQRAEAVMAGLVNLGVDASHLKAEGYGQEHPIADNSTAEGRAKNRRIDIRVVSK
jgi:outer membrane protein OmpA-like peptidoglycan-associated protein